MKTLIVLSAIAILAGANNAMAQQEIAKPCVFENYQELKTSISDMEIRSGEELKVEVLGVLAQEMGPTCESVVQLNRMGIPGRSFKEFRLKTGETQYNVSIIQGGVEDNDKSWVTLSRSEAK